MTGRSQRWPHLATLFLVLCVGVISIGWGDRVTVNGGYGWDGAIYGRIVERFPSAVLRRQVDGYHLTRILPSVLVALVLRALDLPRDGAHVILAFGIYNLVLLLGAGLLWWRIADELRLSPTARWIGSTGLFGNFAVLRQSFFYPVLMDVTALTLGLGLLYAYLRRRPGAVFATSLAAAFTWPLGGILGVALLLFSRGESTSNEAEERSALPAAASSALVLLLASVLVALYYGRHRRAPVDGSAPIVEPVFYLSALVFLGLAFLAMRELLRGIGPRTVLGALRRVRWWQAGLALFVLVVPALFARHFANPADPPFATRTYLGILALSAVSRPAIALVAHTVYFGPVVLLVIRYWPAVCRAARRLGLGIVVGVALTVLTSMGSESRQSIMGWAVVSVLIAVAAEQLRWTWASLAVLVGGAAVLTKPWLRLNGRGGDGGRLAGQLQPYAVEYQHYFMQHGPWMSNANYLWQLALVLGLGISLARLNHLRSEGRVPAARPARASDVLRDGSQHADRVT